MFEKRWWAVASVLFLMIAVACGGGADSGSGTTAPAGDHAKPADATPPAATPASGAPGKTGTASIAGTVRYDGDVPNLRPIKMDADPGCAKKHDGEVAPEVLVLGANKTLANVIVYVNSGLSGGTYPTPTDTVTLDQVGCQYTPHAVSVQTGQPFKILNSDGLLHNVHGLPKANPEFNRAMPATVTQADYTFNKEEVFKVKCDVHPWMGAWIGVFAHPFHGVTATDGAFSLDGLPAGTYEVAALHERLGTLTAQVTVGDGQAASHEFVFKMP